MTAARQAAKRGNHSTNIFFVSFCSCEPSSLPFFLGSQLTSLFPLRPSDSSPFAVMFDKWTQITGLWLDFWRIPPIVSLAGDPFFWRMKDKIIYQNEDKFGVRSTWRRERIWSKSRKTIWVIVSNKFSFQRSIMMARWTDKVRQGLQGCSPSLAIDRIEFDWLSTSTRG